MSDNRVSWVFLGTSLFLLTWGAWLKFNGPEPAEEKKEWVRRGGKLVGRENGEPYQGVREVPFTQAPTMIEWEYHYVDGVRHGPGKEFYPGPTPRLRSLATYVDGQRQGPVTTFYRSGIKKMQATAVDDFLEGLATFYEPDGTVRQRKVFKRSAATTSEAISKEPGLAAEETITTGAIEGEEPAAPRLLDPEGEPFTGTQVGTFRGGAKAFEHGYRDGRPHGVHQGWAPGGEPEYQRRFVDGARHGTWQLWAEDGSLIAEENFHHGKAHGVARFWHPGGERVRAEGRSVHGAKHGTHTVTDADGRKLLETEYDHGRQITIKEWDRKGAVVREESTPLREGKSLTVAADDALVTETIELPTAQAEEGGLAIIGFRFRLSSQDPGLPADTSRPFRVSIVQGGSATEFTDFEGNPAGWVDYQERFEISPGETLALEVKAQPGALDIHLAGIARLDQLEQPEK